MNPPTKRVFPAFAAIALSAVLVCPGAGPIALAHDHAMGEHGTLPPAPSGRLPSASIYQLEGLWTDAARAPVPLYSLEGRPLILAMFYASCTSVCPLIVDEMLKIERELPAGTRDKIGFALFSFDPEHDSPGVLRAYAAKRSLDRPNWRLLTASPEDVDELAAVLGMRIKKEPNGEFAHSTLITLVDTEGVIRGQLAGLNQDRTAFIRTAVAVSAEGNSRSATSVPVPTSPRRSSTTASQSRTRSPG
jgi:protein SCO1/2